MIGSFLTLCGLAFTGAAAADTPASPEVWVLEGPEVQHMCDALKRVGCSLRRLAQLDRNLQTGCRVLILCGKAPPAGPAVAGLVKAFVEAGGSVLGVGGGATWMIDHKLFDAQAYYPSGTTIHMSSFHGYHRLTFGYPGTKPEEEWTAGVPMLLRATEGPLMTLGPRASSILGAGRPFSLAAFQRVGKGLVLLIGPDPQGGNMYYTLNKPTLTPGNKLGTDRLLSNAVAFLQDPHSGFEENAGLAPPQSHWQVELRNGAACTWSSQGAPEGKVFLQIVCPPRSSGSARPFCPIVVEAGTQYQVACLHKASVPWKLELRFFRGEPDALKAESASTISLPPSKEWKRHEGLLAVPGDVHYVGLAATLTGPGELSLDEVTLQRAKRQKGSASTNIRSKR
jgi:hypothetical protein